MSEKQTPGEARAQLIVDTIPTMAWTLRPDGVVDFLNKRWSEYVGPSPEAMTNPNLAIHPDDLSAVLAKWKVSMAAGTPYEQEMRIRRHDGHYRWFLVRTAPLADEFG